VKVLRGEQGTFSRKERRLWNFFLGVRLFSGGNRGRDDRVAVSGMISSVII
jgi:hypothetical protein